MLLTLWGTFALVVWLVLWAIGAKALDTALLAIGIFLVGITIYILRPYLPGSPGRH